MSVTPEFLRCSWCCERERGAVSCVARCEQLCQDMRPALMWRLGGRRWLTARLAAVLGCVRP